jgi:hypothetical protein
MFGIKREVWCKSGTIPVAVSSKNQFVLSTATVLKREGKEQWSKSEDLPAAINNHSAFG